VCFASASWRAQVTLKFRRPWSRCRHHDAPSVHRTSCCCRKQENRYLLQTTCRSTRPVRRLWRNILHCYSFCYPSSLFDSSLNLLVAVQLGTFPQLLVTTHYYYTATPRRDSLAAAEHGPSIRFDQRHNSSVLVHFFCFLHQRGKGQALETAFQHLLHSHPQRHARDSNHCAATTSIRFRQPTPTITPSPLQRVHCIMTSRFMDDSPRHGSFTGPGLCTHGVFIYRLSRAPPCHESPNTPRT
jgi:hypothetical protein